VEIVVPDLALVVLIGTSGAGKSTFAARHFLPTEVVSSDACRALVADDPADQAASEAAFEVLHLIVARRLARGRMTVVDATNVRPAERRTLLALAAGHHVPAIAVVLDLPPRVAAARDAARGAAAVGAPVRRAQRALLLGSRDGLAAEGFARVVVLSSPDEVDAVTVRRVPRPTDRRGERGPFDVIGDVHGCHEELCALLDRLGYRVGERRPVHPDGRRAVFAGDLVGRGPDTPGVLRLVGGMVAAGSALAVQGNHEAALLAALAAPRSTPPPAPALAPGRWAGGDPAAPAAPARTAAEGTPTAGGGAAAAVVEALERQPGAFRDEVRAFLAGLPSHLLLDGGRLVVVHAGLPRAMHGRDVPAVTAAALGGVEPGWADAYRGSTVVVHGHLPVRTPTWRRRTIDIDTGCVYGGHLTALRWPERALVSVPAARAYARRPDRQRAGR